MHAHDLHRVLLIALLTAGVLLAVQTVAGAHAALVSSRPEPGAELTTAPGVVELTFTEPLIADLSSLVVTDPDGRTWQQTAVGEQSMRTKLATNSTGVYTVEWKTVSPVDGHTLRGSFRFGVGVAPGQAEATASIAPEASDLLLAVARAVEYAGLLAAVGMLLVTRLARRDPPLAWVRSRAAQALAAALAAGILVVVGEALLAASTPSLAAVGRYLSAEPGLPRLVRLAAEAAALAGAWLAPSRRSLTTSGTVVAIAALAASGHAAAARPAWWGITVDAGHLLGAGLWAGGVLALATQHPPGGWRSEDAKQLLARFTPPALGGFLLTVAAGTLRSVQELVGASDLLSTSYGQVLTVKILVVAGMVPLSLRAWRRHQARPRAEAALAVVVVAAAALLAAYPVPPQRAAEDAHRQTDGANPALPRQEDLTFGGASSDVLVGVTVRPGRPGRNDVLVYLLPVSGEEAAAELAAELTVGDDTQPLESCGPTCRRTSVTLDGGETLAVGLPDTGAEPAVFDLPDLPTPDGTPLLEQVDARMTRVDTLRYEEVLGPVDPPLRTTVEMVRPNRIHVTIHTLGRETIRIGDDRYKREAGQPWTVVTRDGVEVNVPAYIWDYQPRIGLRVVGTQRLGDVDATIVSFFVDHSSGPIWYRLWIDDEGLVRRAEMRATGHFMDHDYFDFNAPITIEPPL